MTTSPFRPRPMDQRISRSLLALGLLAVAPLCAACGAQSKDSIDSTDTGNPPAIDETVLRVEAGEAGQVVVSGDAGAVTPGGSKVTVTNEDSGASASTKSKDDGSFEVTLAGAVDDEYEVTVEAGGDTDSVVLGAGATDPNALSNLVGKSYLMQSAEGFMLVPQTSLRITFGEADFSFSGGCNGHSGTYSFCEGKLCLMALGSTAIGCDEDRHMQDAWLAEFFTSTPALSLVGDELTVTGEDATLVFQDSETANPDRPLTGRVWTIDTLIQGDAATNVPVEVPPTLEFSEDGTIQVSDTCVQGSGSYEVNDDTLTFGPMRYPDESCAETFNESVRDHIHEVLQGEVTFEIDEARLWLNRGDVGLGATTD